MDRVAVALNNHKRGYNCAQAVLCAFADLTDYSENELFKIAEAFGGGIGGSRNVCGAVSAIVMFVGIKESAGVSSLPNTNKIKSYSTAKMLMDEFSKVNKSIVCGDIKDKKLRSCDGCIEDAVKILGDYLRKI